jgi:hypothetical protein
MPATAQQWTAAEIGRRLAARVDTLVPELLPGAKRDGAEWRAGSTGGEPGRSLGVHRLGSKAGVWSDFSTGECGDALDLAAAVMTRGHLGDALRWAIGWLGLGDAGHVATERAASPPDDGRQPPDDGRHEQSDEDGSRAAQAMWLSATPDLVGTPVAHYLAARRIDLAEFIQPIRALRFAPALWCHEAGARLPAMVAAITGADGRHTATHRTWLAQQNGVWTKAPVATPKKVRGRIDGGSIRLWRGAGHRRLAECRPDEIVGIGEGIETCLSVAIACPELRVVSAISLGNMASIALPNACRRVVLLADNDKKPQAQSALLRAVNAHIAAGREVRVARAQDGKDFNDVLR